MPNHFIYADHKHFVGAFRSNRVGVPYEFVSEPLAHGKPLFSFADHRTLVKYQAKENKTVFLLSMAHHDAVVSCGADGKSKIVLDYNKSKGDVDTLDQTIKRYSCRPITFRWPSQLFGWILDAATLNASRLYLFQNKDSIDAIKKKKQFRRRFLASLGHALICPQQNFRATAENHWYSSAIRSIHACYSRVDN